MPGALDCMRTARSPSSQQLRDISPYVPISLLTTSQHKLHAALMLIHCLAVFMVERHTWNNSTFSGTQPETSKLFPNETPLTHISNSSARQLQKNTSGIWGRLIPPNTPETWKASLAYFSANHFSSYWRTIIILRWLKLLWKSFFFFFLSNPLLEPSN